MASAEAAAALKEKIKTIAKKFNPIAPKPFEDGKKIIKNGGTSLEDKRKILEMELEKLKKQIKSKDKKCLRSYPSPIEKDFKLKMSAGKMEKFVDCDLYINDTLINKYEKTESKETKETTTTEEYNNILLINVLSNSSLSSRSGEECSSKIDSNSISTAATTATSPPPSEQIKFSPSYVLYENSLQSTDTQFYVLED